MYDLLLSRTYHGTWHRNHCGSFYDGKRNCDHRKLDGSACGVCFNPAKRRSLTLIALLTRNIDIHAFPIRLIAWNHSTFGVNQPIHSHKRIKCLVCRRYCNKRILKRFLHMNCCISVFRLYFYFQPFRLYSHRKNPGSRALLPQAAYYKSGLK